MPIDELRLTALLLECSIGDDEMHAAGCYFAFLAHEITGKMTRMLKITRCRLRHIRGKLSLRFGDTIRGINYAPQGDARSAADNVPGRHGTHRAMRAPPHLVGSIGRCRWHIPGIAFQDTYAAQRSKKITTGASAPELFSPEWHDES